MLTVGQKLPKFSLLSQDGKTITHDDFIGHFSVLYFYPKDDTPGCTKEACGFTEEINEFKNLSVPVYGVSPDPAESHKKFADKYKLKVTLIADPDKKLCKAMGVIGEKNLYGKIVVGLIRTTFIIDPQGKIADVFKNVKVAGHVEKVKERIRELTQKN